MTSLNAVVLTAVAAFNFGGDPVSPPVSASNAFRASLKHVQELQIYEGLPHQVTERELKEREEQRDDVTTIDGFPFYTPAVAAKESAELKKLIRNGNTFLPYAGKFCGEFHPDYAIAWTTDGKTYFALICFGCAEAKLYDGKSSLPYSLNKRAFESFKRFLAPHVLKRPSSEPKS